MVKVVWDSNFRTLRTQLERSVISQVEKAIVTAAGDVKCPVHGETPLVHVSGKGFDNLSFQVTGCCDQAIAKVEGKLKNL
jgi:hypothetical protein